MKKLLVVLSILTVSHIAIGQSVKGKVIGIKRAPLQGATVAWLNSKKGTVTNKEGEFKINLPKTSPFKLSVSHAGYRTDTLVIADTGYIEIALAEKSTLTDVTVLGNRAASFITSGAAKTEVITALELKKAACCDLAGCFETQASVQPQTTNIITNSKELRILGLSGIYNQVLIDGFPLIQGLSYTYGISSIPGVSVENIWIAKGANSVLQGYESISGQINVITKEPDKADKLFLNGYINTFGEKHLNVLSAYKNKKWSNLTTFHMVQPSGRYDKDEDTFLDLPLLTRYMIANRWKKGDENKWGWSTQIGIRYLSEKRVGGQENFNYKKDKGSATVYGQVVEIQQPEGWFKTAYRMNDEHRFAVYVSGFHQEQETFFGITRYKAKQSNTYANLQYEWSYKGNSTLKTGFSYRHLDLNENITFYDNSLNRTYTGIYKKKESIPGVFAENTLNTTNDKITWILGVRADNHNRFGWQITPRTLVKYQPTEELILRGSVGTGWRTANIFSENIGLLVSSRDILFEGILDPEKAVNFGFNATQKIKGKNVDGYFSLDFYNTSFRNQIFPDYDMNPSKAIIKNFKGKSISNGFQSEIGATFHKRVTAKVSYVNLDVYQVIDGEKNVLPFNSKHRINSAVSYMPFSKKWHLDANVHWYGSQRLPDTKNNPVIYQMPGRSPSYTIVNSQFTYNIKKFEIYAGVENIFNFRQAKPIIGWQDPFGQYFDTQFAWGPTRGREGYLGVRFTIK